MAQPTGQGDQQRAIDHCLNAAFQFELTASDLRARFQQAKNQPGGLTQADEAFLETYAVSNAGGGRSAAFHAMHPVVRDVINAYESQWRFGNWVHASILAGTIGFGYLGRWTGFFNGDADQVRRGTRYVLEVTRALEVAKLLRVKATELSGQ
jgi:hypothetical protein